MEFTLFDNRLMEAVIAALAGGLVTLIIVQVMNRRARFSYYVEHARVGVSADDQVFGNVAVTWNGNPAPHLFLSTIELKNESLRDFQEVVAKVYTNNTGLLTEQTQIVDTTQIVKWSKEFEGTVLPRSGPATQIQIDMYHRTREYLIPIMNRGQIVRFSILNAPAPGVQPWIGLEVVHPGVKLKYTHPRPEILGVSQFAAALWGLILGFIALAIVIMFVDVVWIAALLCLVFGAVLTLPGALLIRFWYRLRDLLGS